MTSEIRSVPNIIFLKGADRFIYKNKQTDEEVFSYLHDYIRFYRFM
jgi:hypothetical protein